jgi:hypothetical protein
LATIACRAGEEMGVGDAILIMSLGWEGDQLTLWIDVPDGLRPECDDSIAQLIVAAEGYCLYLLRLPEGALFRLDQYEVRVHRLRAPTGVAQLRDTRIDVLSPQGEAVVRRSQSAAKHSAAQSE